MQTENTSGVQKRPSFIEKARRAQLIECAIETIATLGYAQASLAQIARRADISKSVITYYFATREELIKQVVKSITTAAASLMVPQIEDSRTATAKLQAYLRSNIAYIAAHRMHMAAVLDIVLNERMEDGRLRYHPGFGERELEFLEAILRKGQDEGEFRAFDLRTMALAIRGAIDTVGRFLVVQPTLDGETYAQELVTLFERATRKE